LLPAARRHESACRRGRTGSRAAEAWIGISPQRLGRANEVGAGLTTTPRLLCTSITASARSERPVGRERDMASTPEQPLGLVIASTEKSPPCFRRARLAAKATAS